ncbi:MAG: nucleoside deaminase [archaeon]|nr:nucleoside deaminase [archaeon]
MNSEEENFMRLAIEEAEIAYQRGDLPVGAVLTINNNLIGRCSNLATTRSDWFSHAESFLLYQFSGAIKKNKEADIKLYTTWEPCLMCASIASLCRISKMIYACSDPVGGIASLNEKNLPNWYHRHWPKIKKGPFEKESYELLTKYMKEHKNVWGDFLSKFEK